MASLRISFKKNASGPHRFWRIESIGEKVKLPYILLVGFLTVWRCLIQNRNVSRESLGRLMQIEIRYIGQYLSEINDKISLMKRKTRGIAN
jgi:hypothetical protein